MERRALILVGPAVKLPVTYLLPIRSSSAAPSELLDYVRWLSHEVEQVIVIDGSPPPIRWMNAVAFPGSVTSLAPDPSADGSNGKVDAVLTAAREVRSPTAVIADDDVRYDRASLRELLRRLDGADLAVPQNVFVPAPWWARWDTGRILFNRAFGGDFAGTTAVRAEWLGRGYDPLVLFENLELLRTVAASGGTVLRANDVFVARRPATFRAFMAQRVRQAYEDFAIPPRAVGFLAIAPIGAWLAAAHPAALAAGMLGVIAIGELGRRRDAGRRAFATTAALWCVPWLVERAICIWIALGFRVAGGLPYRGTRIRRPANAVRRLRAAA